MCSLDVSEPVAECDDNIQLHIAPRIVPKTWHANISRGGIDMYHPSLRSCTRSRACDMAMSLCQFRILVTGGWLTTQTLERHAADELGTTRSLTDNILSYWLPGHQHTSHASFSFRTKTTGSRLTTRSRRSGDERKTQCWISLTSPILVLLTAAMMPTLMSVEPECLERSHLTAQRTAGR